MAAVKGMLQGRLAGARTAKAAAVRRPHTAAQHIYYSTTRMHLSILNMHKYFMQGLFALRIDETPGLCYSIVTERKQPEIRR